MEAKSCPDGTVVLPATKDSLYGECAAACTAIPQTPDYTTGQYFKRSDNVCVIAAMCGDGFYGLTTTAACKECNIAGCKTCSDSDNKLDADPVKCFAAKTGFGLKVRIACACYPSSLLQLITLVSRNTNFCYTQVDGLAAPATHHHLITTINYDQFLLHSGGWACNNSVHCNWLRHMFL